MDEWVPVAVLPNADLRGVVECDYAALVPPYDGRAEKLRKDHPRLDTFLSKFRSQFGEQAWPSLFLLKSDAPKSYYTAEAVTAFRDILSLSTVPYARAQRLYYEKANSLVFSNTFQFYPWMLDAKYEDLILTNPASLHAHVLEKFDGQPFPEQSQISVMEGDLDIPLAHALVSRWVDRFATGSAPTWESKALFRSLNMANEAARIPAYTAATFYDVGRSLALWVSAYEILAHPGGTGESNFATVTGVLESVKWIDSKLASHDHPVGKKNPQKKPLATWICRYVYDLRNDFLHGNEVAGAALLLNKRTVVDFAGCLFRLALTGFLSLQFDLPKPASGDLEATVAWVSARRRFETYQSLFERALLTAL